MAPWPPPLNASLTPLVHPSTRFCASAHALAKFAMRTQRDINNVTSHSETVGNWSRLTSGYARRPDHSYLSLTYKRMRPRCYAYVTTFLCTQSFVSGISEDWHCNKMWNLPFCFMLIYLFTTAHLLMFCCNLLNIHNFFSPEESRNSGWTGLWSIDPFVFSWRNEPAGEIKSLQPCFSFPTHV